MEEKIVAEIEEENEIEGVIDLEPLRGAQGYSAYEIYLKNLSDSETPMSEQEWLDNLSKANYYKCFSKRIFHQKNDEPLEFIPIESYIPEYNSTCILELLINSFKMQGYGEDVDYWLITYDENDGFFDDNDLDKTKTYIRLVKPIKTNEGIIDVIDINIYKTVVAIDNDYDLLKGEKGLNGKDGLGVPAGGTTGQVLAKKSDIDNDTEWVEQTGKGGTGIAIGGEEPTDTDVKIWIQEKNNQNYDTFNYRKSTDNKFSALELPPTGDTLPIGSIIYFDGDTVPTNYELVDDSGEYKKIKKVAQSVGVVGAVTKDINDTNDNAVPNAKTVKSYIDLKTNRIKLWENSSTSSVMPKNATLNFSNSDYDEIEVVFKRTNVQNIVYTTGRIPKGYNISLNCFSNSSDTNCWSRDRLLERISDTQYKSGQASIQFTNATKYTVEDGACIPIVIYGYSTLH